MTPDTVLRGGDRVHFVGRAEDVLDLQERPGLTSAELPHITHFGTKAVRCYEAAGEAARSIDIEVIVVIAAAFGLAAAMESSGLAETLARGLTDAFGSWGDRGVLLGVVLAVVILTELITNNAAALLMLPIAFAATAPTGLDPRGVAVAIAVGAS